MKKKILIVALIATMLVTMLALPAFADVTNETTDWKYQYVYGSGAGGRLPYDTTVYETHFNVVGGKANSYFIFECIYTGDSVHEEIYDSYTDSYYEININSGDVFTFDSRDYEYDYMEVHAWHKGEDGSSSTPDGEFSVTLHHGGQKLISILSPGNSEDSLTISATGWSVSLNGYSAGSFSYFFGFKDTYVKNLGASKVSATYYSDASAETIVDIFSKYLGQATYGDNVEQRPVNLINMMFGGFTPAVEGLAGGMKDGVAYLLWENPTASVKSLSNFSIFIFVIAGLSIAMTVFFLIFRLIRHGKQR